VDKDCIQNHLEALINRDNTAQEMVYKHYYRYGMSVCLRYTSSREEAVEVLNDSFLNVFTKIEQYDSSRDFKPWFRRVLINNAINHAQRHVMKAKLIQIEDLSFQPKSDLTSDGNLDYQEMIELTRSLSPMYRTVFNLYVIEGFSHEEISNALQISIGASKSNLSRARCNLREMIIGKYQKGVAKYG